MAAGLTKCTNFICTIALKQFTHTYSLLTMVANLTNLRRKQYQICSEYSAENKYNGRQNK